MHCPLQSSQDSKLLFKNRVASTSWITKQTIYIVAVCPPGLTTSSFCLGGVLSLQHNSSYTFYAYNQHMPICKWGKKPWYMPQTPQNLGTTKQHAATPHENLQ